MDIIERLNMKLEHFRQDMESWAFREGLLQPGDRILSALTISFFGGDILDRPVEFLFLTRHIRQKKRFMAVCQRLGIKTLGDLVKKTEWQLREAKNFGTSCINDLEAALATHGLKFQ